METPDKEKNKKTAQKKYSAAYLRQREKANARKRKFLDKMTEEQKEIKRAKDREYFKKKKAEKGVKKITDLTEREKRKRRKDWKNASKKYRERKKGLANLISNTSPQSDGDPAPSLEKKKKGLANLISNNTPPQLEGDPAPSLERKKKGLANLISNTPPQSDGDPASGVTVGWQDGQMPRAPSQKRPPIREGRKHKRILTFIAVPVYSDSE